MLRRLRVLADWLATFAASLGALALALILLTTLVDVSGRYFGKPLYGAQDLVKMLSVFVVFGGMAYCERRGGHVSVDLFAAWFSPRTNHRLIVAGQFIGAIVFAFIAWQVFESSTLSRTLNLATNILQLPRAPFQIAVGLLCGLTSFAMAVRGCATIVDARQAATTQT